MSKVRVCFLGTPPFAATCLKSLFEDEHFEIVGIVTQPDRPAGRKLELTPSAVKKFAFEKGLPCITPESVNKEPALGQIIGWSAEIAVVVAFGQILSQKFLDSFVYGAVNVHGSILPKWRGAAPIQRALENGDKESGVTLQKVVKELDAGDIIGIRKINISEDMNASELFRDLATLSQELLHVELMDFVRGNLAPIPQDHNAATYAKKIGKSEAEMSWQMSAQQIHNRVRAFTMGPGTWISFQGKKLKIHKTHISSGNGQPGTVLKVSDSAVSVATGQGAIEIVEVQPESRNRMLIQDFIKGYPLKPGDKFA